MKIKEALIGKTGWCQDEVTEVGGALKGVKTVLVVGFFPGHRYRLKNLLNSCLEVYTLKYVLSAEVKPIVGYLAVPSPLKSHLMHT